MAVRKIAVIALVVIVACPILLGYALNLTETTETDYRTSGDPVNVTPLIQNGTTYTYSHGNTYQLNTNFKDASGKISYPQYKSITTANTSFKGNVSYVSGHNVLPGAAYVGIYSPLFYYKADYTPSVGSVTCNFYTYVSGVYTLHSVANFHSANYDFSTSIFTVTYYTSDTTFSSSTYTDFHHVDSFTPTAGYTGSMYVLYCQSGDPYHINLAGGFQLHGLYNYIELPTNTRSLLMTIDLDSITDPNYSFMINNGYVMEKTTVSSVVHWKVYPKNYPSSGYDLYYNPGISHNTYQILIQNSETEYDSSLALPYKSTRHTEFRYVGNWPSLIGEANYYHTYSFDTNVYSLYDNVGLDEVMITTDTYGYSPVIRVDDSTFRAFETQSISNITYTPADFKINPATTLSSVTKFGSSLIFGGNTYNVSDGKITISGRSVPVEGLVMSSIPNDLGTYDNKIGNTVISTTASPSTITFKGIWAASVSTDSMEQYSYTHTEWNAGSFAWDGIDQNFLIVGLVTCLGVFVALGIYARKSRSGGIIPLMIVTGCAAAVFFIML